MIISINVEHLKKIQHPLPIKNLSKLQIEESFFNLIKTIYEKYIVNIILHSKKLKTFPQRSGRRQKYSLSFLFNIVLEVLANAIRQGMDIN